MDRNSKVQPNTLGIVGFEVETKFGPIIAAGPLSKQPGTVAFRVVLVQRNDHETGNFVVWTQYFPNFPDRSVQNLEQGNYFQSSELVEATTRFAERVALNAGTLASIYRQPQGYTLEDNGEGVVGVTTFPRLA